jgi:hypothetical protein
VFSQSALYGSKGSGVKYDDSVLIGSERQDDLRRRSRASCLAAYQTEDSCWLVAHCCQQSCSRLLAPVFKDMTKKCLAQVLIEGPGARDVIMGLHKNQPVSKPGGGQRPDVDKKIAVYLNRLLLRIFSVPALMSYLSDVALFPTGTKDGECKIQLVFHKLPDEVHPQMLRLFAAPGEAKLFKFVDKNQARTGVEMVVKPDDFGGEDIDYAL